MANGNETKDLNYYLPLFRAALKGDWESAVTFLERDSDAVNARIDHLQRTTLHWAVETGRSNHFVEKLVGLMSASDLALQDEYDKATALSIAAAIGNLEAARLMVEKNPDLPNIRDRESTVPLLRAIQYNHNEMVLYLLDVTRSDIRPSPFAGEYAVKIMDVLLIAGFYDVALDMLHRYPDMAKSQVFGGKSPLNIIATKPSDFPSGSGIDIWQRLIYLCVPPCTDDFIKDNNRIDVENPAESADSVPHDELYLRPVLALVKLFEFLMLSTTAIPK